MDSGPVWRSCVARVRCLPLWTGILLIVAGCGGDSTAVTSASLPPLKDGAKLNIVTTTGMVADLVQQIAGERATVTALMGPGSDPHMFKPTRNDVRKLLDADVVISSGLMLEHRLQETVEQIARGGKPCFAVTDRLERSRLRAIPGSAGMYDPHVWMDVELWSQCARDTSEHLAELQPERAAEFQQRADAYCGRLAELDRYVQTAIASIPTGQRVLVTAHDAFGYFSDRYQMEVRSVQGVSTESEAGIQDVNTLIDFLVQREVPAVFLESSVSPRSLQAVLEGCRSRGKDVKLGGELFSDAMGAAGTYEGTYLGMIDANATRITFALGGTAPAGGWQGKLVVP